MLPQRRPHLRILNAFRIQKLCETRHRFISFTSDDLRERCRIFTTLVGAEFDVRIVGTASGPLSAYDWTESADWTTRPRSNIDWACDNPNLHLPGSARDNFFEDVMHEDALGVRQILCGGDLLFISHHYFGSLLLGKTS